MGGVQVCGFESTVSHMIHVQLVLLIAAGDGQVWGRLRA